MRTRLTLLFVGFVALGALLVTRAAWVQIKPQPRLAQLARRQFQSHVLVTPRRGVIVDRNQETLAGNSDSNSLAANPSKLSRRKNLAKLLAQALSIPYSRVIERLTEKREFVWIKRQLSETDLKRLRRWSLLKGDGELHDGLFMVRESKRVYPHGRLAAHVLGHVNVDAAGLEGVELWRENDLKGKGTSFASAKDALGRPSFVNTQAAGKAQDGSTVQLTLDASLQFVVEELLADAVRKFSARSGTVIVMDSTTGAVLAMANEPIFDPSDKAAPPERRRNRAVTDGYEPGSTLKPLLVAVSLAQGGHMTDRFWGERGAFRVQGKLISEAESHEKFEWIDMNKILQVSSNVGAAKIALKVGAPKFLEGLRKFGFGGRSGLGFPGEIAVQLPELKQWTPLRLANVGFGQGVLVTPIQMTRAFAVLANGGWLVTPTLMAQSESSAPKRVLNEKVAQDVTFALERVTQKGGTGTLAAVEGFRIAGKTGTAQMADPLRRGYLRDRYVNSFIGYPMGTAVKPVVFVSLHEPKGGYAAFNAAPLFRSVMTAVLQRLGIKPTESIAPKAPVLAQAPQADRIVTTAARAWIPGGFQADGKVTWKLPDWRGLSVREALVQLQGKNFQIQTQRVPTTSHGALSGIIQRQIPEPGEGLAEGGEIRLVVNE